MKEQHVACAIVVTLVVTLTLCAGCAPSETKQADVALTGAALEATDGCDVSGQSGWAGYSQNILGHRCVSGDELPTSETAAGLSVQWEQSVNATTSTPIISHGRMYFGDHDANFYAVKPETGELVWQVNLFTPDTESGFDPIRSSATATNKHVYVSTGHTMYKLDRKDGAVIWSHLMDPHWAVLIDSSPTLAGDKLLIGVASFEDNFDFGFPRFFAGSVVALDVNTGDEIWRTYTTSVDANSGPGVSVWGSVVVDEERQMAFAGTGNAYEEPAAPLGDSLLALDLATGEILWAQQYVAGDVFTPIPTPGPGPDSDVGGTPNLFTIDGQDVVGAGSKSGEYRVFNRATGDELMSVQLLTAVQVAASDPNIPDYLGTAFAGGIVGSAAVANGVIYVNSNVWFYYDFWSSGVNNPGDTSVTYAIDAATGEILWSQFLSAPHFGGLTKVNDVIYQSIIDGHLVGLNAADGSVVLYEPLPGAAGGGVSAQGTRLYVGYGFTTNGAPVPSAGVRAYSLD